jgi:hypothetical protein
VNDGSFLHAYLKVGGLITKVGITTPNFTESFYLLHVDPFNENVLKMIS